MRSQRLIPWRRSTTPGALAAIRWLRQWRSGPAPVAAAFDTVFHSTFERAAFTYCGAGVLALETGCCRFGFQCVRRASTSRGGDGPHGHHNTYRPEAASAATWAPDRSLRRSAMRSIDHQRWATPFRRAGDGQSQRLRGSGVDCCTSPRTAAGSRNWSGSCRRRVGWRGLSGLSGDMRQLREAGSKQTMPGPRWRPGGFSLHRLLQGIGAMAASLGGVDVIGPDGWVGENDTSDQVEPGRTAGLAGAFALVVLVPRRRGGGDHSTLPACYYDQAGSGV